MARSDFHQFVETSIRPVDERLAFVIMPFALEFEGRYRRVIRPALERLELTVRRADEIYGTDQLIGNIVRSLQEAAIVVADLSGRNPNVLYELGLANGFGKDVLLMASDAADVPADLRHLTYVLLDEVDDDAATEAVVHGVRAMREKRKASAPATRPQRLLTYADALGVVDIVPASERLAFDLMLTARTCVDIVLMSGRTFTSIHMRDMRDDLLRKFRETRARVLLVDPESEHVPSYYDRMDGLGQGSCAALVDLSLIRLKTLGLRPRLHRELLTWGGVLVDRSRAMIQFLQAGDWETYFLVIESRQGGMFDSFQTKFDGVHERASERGDPTEDRP